MNTILIVEDEEDVLDLLEYNLNKENYNIICCIDTKNVEAILSEEKVDLIIMDRNLPKIEGSLFIKQIREKGNRTPVIYLSAKDSSDNILEGFERGADDYITKPFNINELKARIKAVIKRTSQDEDVINHRDIVYNKKSKIFNIAGNNIELTHLEHDLLLEFLKNKDILLSRETLLVDVWKDSFDKKIKTVNVAIKRLKEKIDPDNSKKYIKAVRGEGYILC
jgi:DNA-binding response OmpR family regulator